MAVRREKVIVELEDNFTARAAKMAAASHAFRKSVDDSGRSVVTFDRTVRSTPSIDQFSGRLGLIAKAAAAVGPAIVPITTAAVPALAGLSTSLGFAAAGAGTAVLAFNGIGDALEALNEYQLEPTSENFAKLQEDLKGLGPAAREFVVFLDQIGTQLQTVREAAQEGLLPGAKEGLEALLTRLPQVRDIVAEIADTTGDLLADAGGSLASSEWDQFFDFLESEARPALNVLGQTVGNLARGLAELWMAFDPLSDDFTFGLLEASEAFAEWADNLSRTEGFADFLAYVRETGPQVLDTIGSLANMLLQVAEAAAPLGGPVLRAIEGIADVIAAIADSSVGAPLVAFASAMSAVSLAMKGFAAVQASAMVSALTGIGSAAPGAARGLDQLRVAAAGLLVLEGAGLVVEQLQGRIEATLPSIQQMTRDLIALRNAGASEDVETEFDNLGLALDRLDPSVTQGIADGLYDIGAAGGTLGKGLAGGIASMVGLSGQFADSALGLETTREAFTRLDQALVSIATRDGIPAAREAFADLAISEELTVDQQRLLLEQLPGYTTEIDRASAAADNHSFAVDGSTDALDREAQALQDVIDKMRERREEALLASGAEIGFEQAKDDAAERVTRRQELRDEVAAAERELAEARGFGDIRDASDGSRIREAREDLADADTASERENARERLAAAVKARNEAVAAAHERRADAIERAKENLAALREELEDYAPTLDTSTQAGRDNQAALDRMAESWNNLTEKQQNAKGAFQSARDDLIDQAMQFGATREEAEKYADKVLEIPSDVVTQIRLDKEEAEARLKEFAERWNTLRPKKLLLEIELRGEHQLDRLDRMAGRGIPGAVAADGLLMDFYASGGIRPRIGDQRPQVRPYSGKRGITWSEEGSGPWEAFISGHPGKRARSRQIANEVVSRLGGATAWRAADGMVLSRGGGGAGITGDQMDQLAAAVAKHTRPLYRDVYVADGTDFLRTLEQDRKRASLDGRRPA